MLRQQLVASLQMRLCAAEIRVEEVQENSLVQVENLRKEVGRLMDFNLKIQKLQSIQPPEAGGGGYEVARPEKWKVNPAAAVTPSPLSHQPPSVTSGSKYALIAPEAWQLHEDLQEDALTPQQPDEGREDVSSPGFDQGSDGFSESFHDECVRCVELISVARPHVPMYYYAGIRCSPRPTSTSRWHTITSHLRATRGNFRNFHPPSSSSEPLNSPPPQGSAQPPRWEKGPR